MTAQEMVDFLRAAAGGGVIHNGRKAYLDAADLIESLMAELEQVKLAHRTEHCEVADYDCVELGRLRKENADLLKIIAELDDDCRHCANRRDDAFMGCIVSDYICEYCKGDCPCKDCRDGSKFVLRGVQEGGAEDV